MGTLYNNEWINENYDVSQEFSYLSEKETPKKRKKNPVDDTEFTYEILLSKGIGKLTRKAEKNIVILVENAIKKTYYKFDNNIPFNKSPYEISPIVWYKLLTNKKLEEN